MGIGNLVTNRADAIALSVAPPSVCTLALLLRGISRWQSKVSFGWDDFFIILGTLLFWGYSGVSLWNSLERTSAHTPEQQLKAAVNTLKALYINNMFTSATFSAAKLSVLYLYKRIFWPKPGLNIAINTLIAISIAWEIAVFIAGVARCIPVHAAWSLEPVPGAHCINLQTMFLAFETINCVTEVAMIIVPIHAVRQLRLPLRLKIGVSAIFAIGLFVAVLSIVRIVEVYSPGAGTEGIEKSGFWGPIQMCAALCIASLPTYRGLLPHNWNILLALQEWYTDLSSRRHRSRTAQSDGEDSNQSGSYTADSLKLRGFDVRNQKYSTVNATTDIGSNVSTHDNDRIPLNNISVVHSVTVA